jgi:hypothetical protein
MTSKLPPNQGLRAVPTARASIFAAYKQATVQEFGEQGLEAVVRALPDDVRSRTVSPTTLWLPEADLVAWVVAIWEGPAARDTATFEKFIATEIRIGFGRFRALLLSMLASPALILKQGPRLWSEFHRGGVFTVEFERAGTADITLSDHPYAESPVARKMFAEGLRQIAVLSKGINPETKHTYGDGAVRVRITWGE